MEMQKLFRGRLIDHVQIVTADLATSRRFYEAVLDVLGVSIDFEDVGMFGADELVKLTSEPLYRFAIETDLDGAITAVTFVVLAGDTPVLTWQVPLDEAVTKVSPLWVAGSDGVDLPAPSVGIAAKKKKDGTTE